MLPDRVDAGPVGRPGRSPLLSRLQRTENHRLEQRVHLWVFLLRRHREAEELGHPERRADAELLHSGGGGRVRVRERVRLEVLRVEVERVGLRCVHVHGVMVHAHGLQGLPVAAMQPVHLHVVVQPRAVFDTLLLLLLGLPPPSSTGSRALPDNAVDDTGVQRCAPLAQRIHDTAAPLAVLFSRGRLVHLDVVCARVGPEVVLFLPNGVACLVRQRHDPLAIQSPGVMGAIALVAILHLKHHLGQLLQERPVRASCELDESSPGRV